MLKKYCWKVHTIVSLNQLGSERHTIESWFGRRPNFSITCSKLQILLWHQQNRTAAASSAAATAAATAAVAADEQSSSSSSSRRAEQPIPFFQMPELPRQKFKTDQISLWREFEFLSKRSEYFWKLGGGGVWNKFTQKDVLVLAGHRLLQP